VKNIYYAVRSNQRRGSIQKTQALASRLGGQQIYRKDFTPTDASLLIHWGFKPSNALMSAIEARTPFVILDRGYFDENREQTVSISFNGHHGLSMPVDGVMSSPPRPHPRLQDWRNDDCETILVCGQVDRDASLRGMDSDAWMHRAATDAIAAHKMKVVKRQHPKAIWPPRKNYPTLANALDEAYMVCTYSSTVAVQSVIEGIPTAAYHRASPAYAVCSSDSSARVRYPGRASWIHDLSYRQYDLSNDADAACSYIEMGWQQANLEAYRGEYDVEGLVRG
jgi:hypothetical protein